MQYTYTTITSGVESVATDVHTIYPDIPSVAVDSLISTIQGIVNSIFVESQHSEVTEGREYKINTRTPLSVKLMQELEFSVARFIEEENLHTLVGILCDTQLEKGIFEDCIGIQDREGVEGVKLRLSNIHLNIFPILQSLNIVLSTGKDFYEALSIIIAFYGNPITLEGECDYYDFGNTFLSKFEKFINQKVK